MVWFIDTSDPLYVYGPTGCGKTSVIKQLAAKLNYPVFEVTGHSRLEFPELVGHHVVRQGNMEFEYGPLALAMKFGGLFLCNEMDLLEPSTAAGLNGILDGQPLCIPENGGELVVQHPMFRFAATANSNGGSDWADHDVTAKQVYGRQSRTKEGSEKLYEVTDQIIKKHREKGNLK